MRRRLPHQLGQPPLVHGVEIGVEQADGDRLHAVVHEAGDHAAGGRLVERPQDGALGHQPLVHLAA